MSSCHAQTPFLNNIARFFQHNNATFKLLTDSVPVSISGAFRVYIAALLLNVCPSLLICLASGLIIYSVYTLDRALDCEEDLINREELRGSCKEVGLAFSLITFFIGSYIFMKAGILALAFLPLITGFLYSKGFKIGKFKLRLKGGLGVKNIVVGITWGACTAGVIWHFSNILPLAVIFLLYGTKTAINSVIDDFKDTKGDALTGIKTLPVCLGAKKTRTVLLVLHTTIHLILWIALSYGIIAFEPIIIGCSFICGLVCIVRYTNEEKYKVRKQEMMFFKDGESAFIVVLKAIEGALF